MKNKFLSLVLAGLFCSGPSFSAYVEEVEDSAVVSPLSEMSKGISQKASSLQPVSDTKSANSILSVVKKNENALSKAGYTLLSKSKSTDSEKLEGDVYYRVNKSENGQSSLGISQLNYQDGQEGSWYSISSYTLPFDEGKVEKDAEQVVADFVKAQQQEAKRSQEILELRNQIINAQSSHDRVDAKGKNGADVLSFVSKGDADSYAQAIQLLISGVPFTKEQQEEGWKVLEERGHLDSFLRALNFAQREQLYANLYNSFAVFANPFFMSPFARSPFFFGDFLF